jgi:hypothetical protein
MILNWFKYNFKYNKRTILEINKELKNIKNKEFIKQLYDICLEREYPVKEIFCGIILACAENVVIESLVKDLPPIFFIMKLEQLYYFHTLVHLFCYNKYKIYRLKYKFKGKKRI